MHAPGPVDDDPPGGSGGGGWSNPSPNVQSAVAALVKAVTDHRAGTSDRSAVRAAIARWRRDAQNQEARPEQVLVAFKTVLEGMPAGRHYWTTEAGEAEYRELIRVCIEEYYSTKQD